MLSDGKNPYANAPHYYVARTLPELSIIGDSSLIMYDPRAVTRLIVPSRREQFMHFSALCCSVSYLAHCLTEPADQTPTHSRAERSISQPMIPAGCCKQT